MKITQGDELPWRRGLEHRGGMFHFRNLMEGEAGRLDNFQLSLGVTEADFYSPRHRHNFEQIRVQIDGTLDYDRDGKMSAGVVGYFPEAVPYGPQSQNPAEKAMAAVLQFGGASGSGYLSRNEVKAGMDALASQGEFKDGVFRRHADVEGKRNMDGYQAIWENARGQAMQYPEPRYSRPFLMDPTHYQWLPVAGTPGAAEKLLGVFTECRTTARLLKLDEGANITLTGRAVYLVLSGAGSASTHSLRPFTTLFLEAGETLAVTAGETCEIMHFGLPDLSHLSRQDNSAMAVAAE
jgi:hypothetical protein